MFEHPVLGWTVPPPNPAPKSEQGSKKYAPCYVDDEDICPVSNSILPYNKNSTNQQRQNNWDIGSLPDSKFSAYTYAYSEELEESGSPGFNCVLNRFNIDSKSNPIYKLQDISKNICIDDNKYSIKNNISSSPLNTAKGFYINVYDLGSG
jgi:hypothetical protein